MDVRTDRFRSEKLFIGGEWVDPVDGEIVSSIDPATGGAWATAALGGKADIDRAVDAAQAALRGPWARWSVTERSNLLRRIAQLCTENVEELAACESRDNGMLLKDARASIGNLATWFNYFASLADTGCGRQIPLDPSVHAFTQKVPVGVVGAIVAWNTPLLNTTWKIGPALATGCAIVIKPAEQTPVSTMLLGRILEKAGVPAGVVNIVPGIGRDAGAHLAAHERVNKIAFTGEHRTAQEIMRQAAASMKRLSFECGGKAPHIIFDDARLDQALNAVTASGFALCGQSCALGSRILVHRSVYQTVVDELARRATRIRVGRPDQADTQMGPQAHEAQLKKTLSYMELGQNEGARLAAGGARLEGDLADGYFVKPTVFADVSRDMRIAQEEIFGPVVGVIPFDDEDEAVEIANSTQYGLVAGAWTENLGRAHRMVQRIRAGVVWVNTYRYVRWSLPYGGLGISGLGRENGPDALDAYQETKTAVMNLTSTFPDPYSA
ncbi:MULTISPECIES: aldehyde dehydrogenase family protein [unclassified Mesorhizobium]|uniref:aldehyde dehydrogenase family protein n=1 Tax=unclassified Mesorhizobium TaxID=325217 RepID=UPI00095DA721|nr:MULTISPECIES: aldehyde dehydrogenase family protein [unclassified Mesorhizobium]MBN9259003.1 aldehyde dehydrogenase family protein [Mesorhizobium sp.]OJX75147.1 MAG: aldehyde dehydrogenase [Mesorhizobium sp. 65-26]